MTITSQAASTASIADRKAHMRCETLSCPECIASGCGRTIARNTCTQRLMGITASYATNSILLINRLYGDTHWAVANGPTGGGVHAATASAAMTQKGLVLLVWPSWEP